MNPLSKKGGTFSFWWTKFTFLNAAPSTSHTYLRGMYRIQLLLRGPAVGRHLSPKMESMWQTAGQHENMYVLTTIFDMSDLSPEIPQ